MIINPQSFNNVMFFNSDYYIAWYVATHKVSCGCYVLNVYMQFIPPLYSQSSDQIIVSINMMCCLKMVWPWLVSTALYLARYICYIKLMSDSVYF